MAKKNLGSSILGGAAVALVNGLLGSGGAAGSL